MTVHTRWLVGSAVVAFGIYLLLWVGYVQGWAWLAQMDAWALDPLYRFGSGRPGWVTAWDVFCTVLGPGAFRIATVVVIFVAFARRRVRLGIFLIVSVELSGLVTETAKHFADRPRPATAMVDAWGTSFPSGHALGVMASVAALLAVCLPAVDAAKRGWLLALGAVVVLTVGIGRVVLNVHHPSDVLAGWALGYAYFVVCLLLVPPRSPVTQQDEKPAALDIAR
ncbi:phosphatase PAP2 family protein [Mycolicibacterium sp. BiH015]|uniref:phosphatase PAP2 family protein n=1 Tax=Mycolicibacterium sp. BiH015 TaxID=3018808 RepID=UPI0022E3D736|nr:phosphatase PAP2 family protein [Mycolicibacterium sp. BiH015]MDA2891431.1 phosphatase PAP2 family protein [Mycolicibacterium sp. BiH015]